jgi:hypothetical protein
MGALLFKMNKSVPKREAYVGWVLKGLNNEMKSVTHGV